MWGNFHSSEANLLRFFCNGRSRRDSPLDRSSSAFTFADSDLFVFVFVVLFLPSRIQSDFFPLQLWHEIVSEWGSSFVTSSCSSSITVKCPTLFQTHWSLVTWITKSTCDYKMVRQGLSLSSRWRHDGVTMMSWSRWSLNVTWTDLDLIWSRILGPQFLADLMTQHWFKMRSCGGAMVDGDMPGWVWAFRALETDLGVESWGLYYITFWIRNWEIFPASLFKQNHCCKLLCENRQAYPNFSLNFLVNLSVKFYCKHPGLLIATDLVSLSILAT